MRPIRPLAFGLLALAGEVLAGVLEIERLRARGEERLGAGSLPLAMRHESIDAWAAEAR